MAMQINDSVIMYRIEMVVGSVGHESAIVIAERTPHQLTLFPFELVEFLPLRVKLVTNDVRVQVQLQLDETMAPIFLSATEPLHSIYNPIREQYMWYCGVFPFVVADGQYESTSSYEIKPKNVNAEQLQHMHSRITDRVQDLIYNFLNVRQSGVRRSVSLERSAAWQYFDWYNGCEQQLIEALEWIEREDEQQLEWEFTMESRPRKFHAKTFLWQLAHPAGALNNQFLNRTAQPTSNTLPNQFVKRLVGQLLHNMQSAFADLQSIYMSFTSHADVNFKSEQIMNRFYEQYQRHYDTLNDYLQRPFWQAISAMGHNRPPALRSWGYRIVLALWEQSNRQLQRQPIVNQPMTAAPTLRSTDELYEYYSFIIVANVLEQLGFVEDGAVQLNALVGLADGTAMMFQRDDYTIKMTFNEQLPDTIKAARSRKHGLFSYEPNRKPDIRLDLLSADGRYLRRTFIVEVKYRPLFRIFDFVQTTDAMKQLNKYWSLIHVDEAGHFTRSVVEQVVCVYPGHKGSPIVHHSSVGQFVQLYPQSEVGDVGVQELKQLIDDWVMPKASHIGE